MLVASGLMTAPAANASSGKPGSVAVVDYNLGDTAFTDPQSGTVSELRAEVYYPRVLVGRHPLIVMSHGSWWACDVQAATTWPCPAGSHPFPSYQGYAYLGQALAAQGFIVVSISADGINMTSFDYGDRARLVNEHLSLWEQLADHDSGPLVGKFYDAATGRLVAPCFAGHVDMKDVGTMGHSRGGKGVMWQASDKHKSEWPAGVQVRAVLGLAPVKFDDPEGDHSDTLITTLPFAVVTGSCDGAVHEAGQQYLDDLAGQNTAADFSISLRGANHNYYNANWSPPFAFGEDDSTCPSTEMPQNQQRDTLVAYASAFYRYELYGDPSGLPVLTGAQPLPGVTSTTRVVPPGR
ncbi:alpha/beta hydrolase family protein [Catenulispora sp. GAS73]|uniref:alpha/beta hydrolase family protein n=1 Tax=Catenulispora sp. GAS73 TaxID=3156269 RepID=UPI0035163745